MKKHLYKAKKCKKSLKKILTKKNIFDILYERLGKAQKRN